MKTNNYKSVAVLFVALCLLASKFTMASDWVSVGGNVHFGETPVCALVLINGQTQFSCDGTGRYDMQVPVDDNGMVTVMVFADGFAPFSQLVAPDQATEYPIDILLDQNSPDFEVVTTHEPSNTEGRFVVSGTIAINSVPVCALVLANGQNMFSCNENSGQFSLDVPIDQDGNITLMVFADGYKPFKVTTNVVLDTDADDIPDYLDYDDDNDGIFDIDDLCPLDSNPECGKVVVVEPAVKLYVMGYGGFFGGGLSDNLRDPIGSITGDLLGRIGGSDFNEVSFPYSSSGVVNANITGIPAPTKTSLNTFKILAQGQNFTITNLRATDATNRVTPYFTQLSNNYKLMEDSPVVFELVSPLTRGATVNLNYSFRILETGDTFSVSYTFRSN